MHGRRHLARQCPGTAPPLTQPTRPQRLPRHRAVPVVLPLDIPVASVAGDEERRRAGQPRRHRHRRTAERSGCGGPRRRRISIAALVGGGVNPRSEASKAGRNRLQATWDMPSATLPALVARLELQSTVCHERSHRDFGSPIIIETTRSSTGANHGRFERSVASREVGMGSHLFSR